MDAKFCVLFKENDQHPTKSQLIFQLKNLVAL
jgi:hypothetical protein